MLTQLLNFFITTAHADVAAPAAAQQAEGGFSFLVLPAIFLLFFYFVLWRPQSKRAKEQRSLLDSLAKGDEVITTGGVLGKVVKVSDQYLVIALTDQVEIVMQKAAIVGVLPKGTLKSVAG